MAQALKALGLAAVAAGLIFGIRRLYRRWNESHFDAVEEASRESFPASDSPAWNAR